jgi:hypothetical protein
VKLTDLQPRWFDVPGVGTDKDGVTFFCPCARCLGDPEHRTRLAVQFANPVNGEPKPLVMMRLLAQALQKDHTPEERKNVVPPGFLWTRTGETFEALTLTPSVDASPAGHWHGFVTKGEIR